MRGPRGDEPPPRRVPRAADTVAVDDERGERAGPRRAAGPVACPGGNTTVDVAAWDMKKPFEVKHIVSQRSILDLGNLDNSRMMHTTGQSGHPTHRHYDDFIEHWRDVRYHPTLWDRASVEKASRERLRLLPALR